MAKNKQFYFELGRAAAESGATCTYKAGWQRNAWLEGFGSAGMSRRAQAAARAKVLKAAMMAAHPDHGGTCEAFRAAHKAWKAAEHYAASL